MISIWWFLGAVVWAVLATILVFVGQWERLEAEKEWKQLSAAPLTIKELAAQKRVHPSTVAKLIRKGEIQAEKVGRQWRIRRGGEGK